MDKPFLIAEIGINHNGDINIAKQLIDEATLAGFDAVKFQKRDVNLVYSKEILDTPRESPWGTTTREQKNALEFNFDDYKKIDIYCKLKNINWFASAWDLNSLKFLNKFNLKYNKIASAMIVDKAFLNEVAKERKYTFISTGMSTIKNIEVAVDIFKKNNCPFELMHSVSTYPMAVEDANLLTINSLKKYFNCKVGYSGHEDGVTVSLAATSLGISSLERHITLSRSMYGSDQAASLEPRGMRELVSSLTIMIKAFGQEKLGFVTAEEEKVAKKLRAHIKY
jgi:N-acetylneuraminate synthase